MPIGKQTARLGRHQSRVDRTLTILDEQAFSSRLWQKDARLWKQDAEGEAIIKGRLGWLDIVPTMIERADEILSFAEEVRSAGFRYAVLAGMGGTSLSPEISKLAFGGRDSYPELFVLDSTLPGAVLAIEQQVELEKTLFIISSKSGRTIETASALKYFWQRVHEKKSGEAGESFVAITDPGTPLEVEAKANGFRRVFQGPPEVGGRYSALTNFGLVPAAIIGTDIKLLLNRALEMVNTCAPSVTVVENPGIELGTIMAELAAEGRDKLTLVLSPRIASLGCWIEQLVAESTGKTGSGILPVHGEPVGAPQVYGDDRLFVYLKLGPSTDDLDSQVAALAEAGFPVVTITLSDVYDLGREYYRWMIATATACALLGVNAFDQPDVQESKDNTDHLLSELRENGSLPEGKPVLQEDGIKLFCDEETKRVLDEIRSAGTYADQPLLSYISAHLNRFQPGDYFGLTAFVAASPDVDGILRCLRGHLRDAYLGATTQGFGPRFLHSTGQYHKGGPNAGVFIQITADDPDDMPIPGEPYTWGILKEAQAMGDFQALRHKGRRIIRLHLGNDITGHLNQVLALIREAVGDR